MAFGAAETRHDVFPALALAARATGRVSLQSSIAVAFACSAWVEKPARKWLRSR